MRWGGGQIISIQNFQLLTKDQLSVSSLRRWSSKAEGYRYDFQWRFRTTVYEILTQDNCKNQTAMLWDKGSAMGD